MNKILERKIATFFLPIILTYVLGAQKNHLIETILSSTHNIYNVFWLMNKKTKFATHLN